MEALRMARIFMVLLSLTPIIIAWPAVHQDLWTPNEDTFKDRCNASNPINVCSDDCRQVLDCANDESNLFCAGASPLCHKPPNANAVCSESARCKGNPILCAQEGFFPDPYFCTIVHGCFEFDYYAGYTGDCVTSAYNIATGECGLPLDAPVCQDGRVPECTTAGQSGALSGNPSFYYRCRQDSFVDSIIYPLLYMCENNFVYDEYNDECVNSTTTTTTPATTTPDSEFVTCTDDCQGLLFLNNSTACDSPQQPYCHGPPSYNAECSVSARCYGAPLRCTHSDIFPDPYFCDIYHTCYETPYSEVSFCTDSAYNIATGQCDLPLNDPICSSGPVDPCLSLPQSGPLAGNPNYYYVCADDGRVLYPLLYRCPDGEVFDEDIQSCTGTSTTQL